MQCVSCRRWREEGGERAATAAATRSFGDVSSVKGKKKKRQRVHQSSRCAACLHVCFISRGIPRITSKAFVVSLCSLLPPLSPHRLLSLSLSFYHTVCLWSAVRALSTTTEPRLRVLVSVSDRYYYYYYYSANFVVSKRIAADAFPCVRVVVEERQDGRIRTNVRGRERRLVLAAAASFFATSFSE